VPFDPETGEEIEEPETPLIKRLRQQVEDLGKELSGGKEAQRKLAFLEAGVDTSAPAGRLLLEAYKGDLSDTQALTAAATELGVYKGSAPPTTEGATQGEQTGGPGQGGGSVNLETGSQQRQELAAGATAPNPNQKPDARQQAKETFDRAISEQASQDDAAAAWLAVRSRRAAEDAGLI
jgi:hypothetical protein